MKAALLQITSTDDPSANADMLSARLAEAAAEGAGFVLTPEVSNCVSMNRAHQGQVLRTEAEDRTLARMRNEAAKHGIWLSLGSLALKTGGPRFANRSFVIAPDGSIAARYDKIHMFDVELGSGEHYRESSGYEPGTETALAETPFGCLGLTICYDLRFPHLFRSLAQAGASIILVPSAFAVPTGEAHWQTLLRARAIECGAFVLAAAQCGTHPASAGKSRRTYGHSLAVSPWGEILAEAGATPQTLYLTLDEALSTEARQKIPALQHDRSYSEPNGPDH